MKNKVSGFTLIELVMVIVILGILSAVALPKFVDLSGKAEQAAAEGVAGSVASASSINYASYKANASFTNTAASANPCTTTTLGGLMQGGFPSGFTPTLSGSGDCTADAAVTCNVAKNSYSANAIVFCTR